MSSSWGVEIGAVLLKEIRSEMRSRSGVLTAILFDFAALIAAAFATAGQRLTPGAASGLLWVILLFSAVVSLPRTFIGEEEQGTADLLRLTARPHVVFWGKALYNMLFMFLTALVMSALFFALTEQAATSVGVYLLCLLGGSAALAGVVSLCGAFVAQAAHRFVLAGAIAVPALIPLMALAVDGMQSALGGSPADSGYRAAAGLGAYAVASFAIGPHLFAAVWKS